MISSTAFTCKSLLASTFEAITYKELELMFILFASRFELTWSVWLVFKYPVFVLLSNELFVCLVRMFTCKEI